MGCEIPNPTTIEFMERLVEDNAFYRLATRDPAAAFAAAHYSDQDASDIPDGFSLPTQAELAAVLSKSTPTPGAFSQVVELWESSG